jgi:2-keto-4-pentenoate hydratase/2-oxohepta-3-ene-1,7-dioic acid hydratase in catechol pathway
VDRVPAPYFASMLAFLEAGAEAKDHAEKFRELSAGGFTRSLDTVKLLAPVPRPRSIRDCMSFDGHIQQATRTVVKWRFPPAYWLDSALRGLGGPGLIRAPRVWHEQPLYYKGNPASVVGPDAEIEWPAYSEKLDFELEIGFFIGKQGRDIPQDSTSCFIAGFTIFNDFSARDAQLREMQGRLGPAKGKDFDTGNAIGPWLVTPEEISSPYDLTMIARVNGEEWSRASTAGLKFGYGQMISHISRSETLYPGDFIGAGTAPGGCGLELDRWLKPGDEVELEIEGLGVLRNRIVR